MELPTHTRTLLYNKPTNLSHPNTGPSATQQSPNLHRRSSNANTGNPSETSGLANVGRQIVSPSSYRKVSYSASQQPSFTPVLESVNHVVKNTDLQQMQLPHSMTTDDFTRAVAVATVSALRHQQTHDQSPARVRISGADHEAPGGHDAPSWSRTTSASVLLACTFLYALIAGKACH
jgi:Ca2+:H+ antiporter